MGYFGAVALRDGDWRVAPHHGEYEGECLLVSLAFERAALENRALHPFEWTLAYLRGEEREAPL